MEDYFVIGRIVNTQGIKGEMRVVPTTDVPERFKLLNSVLIDKKGALQEYKVEGIRFHKQFVLLKIEGVDNMTDAEKFKNSEIKIPQEQALPLDDNEYYIKDLYEMSVITDEGENLGVIKDIIFTGANDVYVVRNDESEILIPAIKQCILNVDIEKNEMKVKLLEGLR